MSSSAVDARFVIALEKILDAGCAINSDPKMGNLYYFEISTPDGESFAGWGKTVPLAFQDAYRQLPDDTQEVAA